MWRSKGGDKELERRVGGLLSDARAAGSRGDLEGQARLSGEAMDVCRQLLERHPGDPRHLAALAGGLYNHAYRLVQVDRPADARGVLAEAGRHYGELHAASPRRYEVALCDVRLRTALTYVVEGRYDEGEREARAALAAAYGEAGTDDELERAFGEVRAHSLVGRALLLGGRQAAALEHFDAALFAGERLRQGAGIPGTDFAWLAQAPASFRLAAPEWLGSAVAAMELHDAAGTWHIAADAANVAMRIAGGLAAIGDDTAHRRFAAIRERAEAIWWSARNPTQAAAQRSGPFQEFLIGGGGLVRGPRLEPDLTRISRMAGWGPLAAS